MKLGTEFICLPKDNKYSKNSKKSSWYPKPTILLLLSNKKRHEEELVNLGNRDFRVIHLFYSIQSTTIIAIYVQMDEAVTENLWSGEFNPNTAVVAHFIFHLLFLKFILNLRFKRKKVTSSNFKKWDRLYKSEKEWMQEGAATCNISHFGAEDDD